MKFIYSVSGLLILLLAYSCRRVTTLSESDIKFIPYRGSEKLVFATKGGEADTFALTGYHRYFSTENPQKINRKTHIEHYDLMYSYVDNRKIVNNNKFETYLVALTARENGSVIISFNIVNPGKGYFFWNSFGIDSFYHAKFDSLNVDGLRLTDVLIIENKSTNELKSETNSNITRIFWSQSQGLVAYELSNKTLRILNQT